VTLAGIVVARRRPQTAKRYIFILIEDEFGHINVIVKPKMYERCRAAVRMEPFLLVRGRLQKDGATLNVIAHRVEALEVGGRAGAAGPDEEAPRPEGDPATASLPDPLEYWPDPKGRGGSEAEASDGSAPAPTDLLTPLRQAPPEARSWG
jgi:hypothetical protein